jgi:hypothetical protein
MQGSMSDLPKKIQAATQELRQLQRDIQSPLPAAGPRLAEIESAALKEFKAVVDYVRRLIWTYLQADSRESGLNIDEQIRSLRLQHVTEMLHTIQQEVQGRKLESNPATMSFLNAVQEIADAAFKRHSPESKIERAS